MERHGSTVHIMHDIMTVSHATRIAKEDQPLLFVFVILFFVDSLKKKASSFKFWSGSKSRAGNSRNHILPNKVAYRYEKSQAAIF